MKALVIVAALLVLLHYAAAGVRRYDYEGTKIQDGSEEHRVSPSAESSPPRTRRSPPNFDSNHMKGKYAKSNKHKRSAGAPEYFSAVHDMTNGWEGNNAIGYLNPAPALFLAGKPPSDFKLPKASLSD